MVGQLMDAELRDAESMETELMSPTSERSGPIAFGDLTVRHGPSVLEPRPWTTLQSEWAAEVSPSAPEGAILELCSGAGHIGLLAARLSGRALVQVDVNPEACADAERNAAVAGLADRVEVRCTSLAEVVGWGQRYPVVIADPPYIATEGVPRFPEDPVLAIDGGRDGLEVARLCTEVIVRCLEPGGFALLQLGSPEQVDAMARVAEPELTLADRRTAGPTRWVALFTATSRR
jgi:release factor glutamine methyltransferase